MIIPGKTKKIIWNIGDKILNYAIGENFHINGLQSENSIIIEIKMLKDKNGFLLFLKNKKCFMVNIQKLEKHNSYVEILECEDKELSND